MYKFSAPMPYEKDNIEKLINLNKLVKKSRITSLYASLPSTCDMFTGFEQARNIQLKQTSFDYWKDLFVHTIEKEVDFIYLLNNPMPLDLKNPSFSKQLEKLDKLLTELKKIGIKKLRGAAPQLLTYLGKNYSEFDIYASTALDYRTIQEYQNFIMLHKEVKQIVPSHDVNKNFRLLKNLKYDYPDIDIEIMVNEGCMQGCPHRDLHENANIDTNITINNELSLSNRYCASICSLIIGKYPFHSLTLNNNIYPWELQEYAKIGINKFKLVGRDAFTERIESYLKEYLAYFKAIDNFKAVEDVPITTFIHHLTGSKELQQLSTKEVQHLLPKIEHFKKYGHLCASRCGVECRYCYKCAEKIQKVFEKKMREKEKQPHYVPACTMEA